MFKAFQVPLCRSPSILSPVPFFDSSLVYHGRLDPSQLTVLVMYEQGISVDCELGSPPGGRTAMLRRWQLRM